jgi:hypothetical protein
MAARVLLQIQEPERQLAAEIQLFLPIALTASLHWAVEVAVQLSHQAQRVLEVLVAEAVNRQPQVVLEHRGKETRGVLAVQLMLEWIIQQVVAAEQGL